MDSPPQASSQQQGWGEKEGLGSTWGEGGKAEQRDCREVQAAREQRQRTSEEGTLPLRAAGLARCPLLSPLHPLSLLLLYLFYWLLHGPGVVLMTIFAVFIEYSFMFPVHNWKSR